MIQHFSLGYMILAWKMRTRQTWTDSALVLVKKFKVGKPQLVEIADTRGHAGQAGNL